MEKVRLGLIGCGHQGRENLSPAARRVGGAELVACADIDEALARQTVQECGYQRWYADYRQMLEREKLDAVMVVVPHSLLREASLAAIGAGCHLLVEKPLATTYQEGKEVVEAAQQAGRQIMVGYCQRYSIGRLAMKKLLDQGAIGDLVAICAGKGSGPLSGWLVDPEWGGGQLLYLGVHVTDQVLWMLGRKAKRVTARTYNRTALGADDTTGYTVDFEGGIGAQFLCSMRVHGGFDFVEFLGTAGKVRCDWPSERVSVQSSLIPQYEHTTVVHPWSWSFYGQMMDDELREFITALVEGKPNPIPGEAGLDVLKIIDAARASAATATPVEI